MKRKRPALAVVPNAAPPQQPVPAPVSVPLNLSEADRWFAAQTLRAMPWAGGEQVVLGLHRIHTALELFSIKLDKPYAKCTVGAHRYVLDANDAELLVHSLCMAGFKGETGPTLAKLVTRIRVMVNKTRGPAALTKS